jgi:hypothetical protein
MHDVAGKREALGKTKKTTANRQAETEKFITAY